MEELALFYYVPDFMEIDASDSIRVGEDTVLIVDTEDNVAERVSSRELFESAVDVINLNKAQGNLYKFLISVECSIPHSFGDLCITLNVGDSFVVAKRGREPVKYSVARIGYAGDVSYSYAIISGQKVHTLFVTNRSRITWYSRAHVLMCLDLGTYAGVLIGFLGRLPSLPVGNSALFVVVVIDKQTGEIIGSHMVGNTFTESASYSIPCGTFDIDPSLPVGLDAKLSLLLDHLPYNGFKNAKTFG